MTYLWYVLRALIGAVGNRLRGDDSWRPAWLHVRSDILVVPIFAVLAICSGVVPVPWIASLIGAHLSPVWAYGARLMLFSLCWLAWAMPPWGCIYRLWFLAPADRDPTFVEDVLIDMSGGNRSIAFLLRMVLFLLPMGACFGWAWMLLGFAIFAAYVAGWSLSWLLKLWNPARPLDGIFYAELLAGACWGVAISLLSGPIA